MIETHFFTHQIASLYRSSREKEQQGGERDEGGERREKKRTMEREEGKGEGIEKGGDARL